ncbi:carboxymuconolactone decarboxylase family protein [Mycobacteroides chelonae]
MRNQGGEHSFILSRPLLPTRNRLRKHKIAMPGLRIAPPELNQLDSKTRRLLEASPPLVLNSMLAHAEATAAAISELTVQMYHGLQLPPRLRELAILTTANAIECEYEWVQHEVLAAGTGISAKECAALRHPNSDITLFADHEKALIRFVSAAATAPTVSDEIFTAAREYLTERQIIELLELIGLYWMFGRIVTVLQIPTEPPGGDAVTSAITNLQSELQQLNPTKETSCPHC